MSWVLGGDISSVRISIAFRHCHACLESTQACRSSRLASCYQTGHASQQVLGVDDLLRVMAIEVVVGNKPFIIVGVYLPCYANNDDYECGMMTCVGYIESAYNVYQNDMNCNNNNNNKILYS